MNRKLRPRTPVVIAPASISTETCLAHGLPPRKFREALAARPHLPRSRCGQTIIVTLETWHQLLDELREDATAEPDDETGADDGPTTAGDVLARLGLEVAR